MSSRSGLSFEDPVPSMFEISDISSGFHMYDFDKIKMRGFLLDELMLLAKAHANKDASFVVQAVNNVLDVDVNILTIPDFYNMLYWLRIESYPKTPLYMPWKCDEVVDTTTNRVCNTENFDRLSKVSIQVKYLKECEGYDQPLPPGIDYPRVPVYVSLSEKEKDDPLHEIYKVAMWVAEGTTIDEKMRVLRSQKTLELYENALMVANRLQYGVREAVNVNCKECGASRYYILSISAATFLPKVG